MVRCGFQDLRDPPSPHPPRTTYYNNELGLIATINLLDTIIFKMSLMAPNSAKIILITGAASGIGAATAKHLAAEGYRLCLSDINEPLLSTVCHDISQTNNKSILTKTVVDVSDHRSVSTWIEHCGKEAEENPRIEIYGVFNCAGVNPTPTPLQKTTNEYFEKLVSVNLQGTFNVCRVAEAYLNQGAVVVNVSSIMGLHPSAMNSVYCATKYAIIGFSKSLALEWGPRGIRVNVVAPG